MLDQGRVQPSVPHGVNGEINKDQAELRRKQPPIVAPRYTFRRWIALLSKGNDTTTSERTKYSRERLRDALVWDQPIIVFLSVYFFLGGFRFGHWSSRPLGKPAGHWQADLGSPNTDATPKAGQKNALGTRHKQARQTDELESSSPI